MASSGWATLGSALAGNPARQEALYAQGATGVARLEGLLSEARLKRDQEAGLAGVNTDSISAAFSDASKRPDLLAAMFHGKVDPRELSGYSKDMQGVDLRQDLYDRASGGASVAALNPLLAAFEGKVQDVSKVQDGVSYNPTVAPDQNTFDPTQVGLAEIMQKGAQAEAERAQAAASYASAARQRAGIGLDKAANYQVFTTPDGLVRVPLLGGDAIPVTYGGGAPVKPVPKTGAGTSLSAEARAKLGLLDAAQASLDKYEQAAFKTNPDGSRSYDPTTAVLGPAQAFLNDAINGTLRYESGAGVPDYEVAAARGRYAPSTFAREGTNEAKIKLLRDKIKLQRDTLVNGPQGAPAAAPAPSSSSGLQEGHIEDGYRFLGGDPADPKNWEKQ